MSNCQYNIENIPASKLLPNSKEITEVAIQTGLVKRDSKKFDPLAFLLVCVQASISASGTLEQLASSLAKTTKYSMSRSGMHQRFHSETLKFFVTVLYKILNKKFGLKEQCEKQEHFDRVIVEDSTQFKMNANNAEDFPGHGNGGGKTSGCKINFCYDILSNKVLDATLHLATDQDKEIGKQTLRFIKPRDLLLRDMGYFIISEFTAIEEEGAYWLSRFPANVNAYTKSGEKLEQYLAKSKSNSLDLEMYIGEKEAKKVRLVALRVDQSTLEKRRRERNQRDLKSKKTSTAEMKQRDQWHIMVTNIETEKMDIQELSDLYSLRWKIELSFKAWKQSGQMESCLSRKSNKYYLESIIVAGIIRFILSFYLYSLLGGVERLSMDKLFKRFCEWFQKLTSFKNLSKLSGFSEDIRHIQRDLRKKKSLDDTLMEIFNHSLA